MGRHDQAEDLSWVRRWIKKGLSKDKKTLNLANRRITLQTAMDVAENLAVPGVEILYMNNCWLKDTGMEELADADLFNGLKQLWLYDNKLHSEGAVYLSESTKLGKLQYLSLYSNKVAEEGAEAIANAETFENLEVLDLSFNRVGNEGARALAESNALESLRVLHLDANGIGKAGMQALANHKLPKLKELYLTYNHFEPEGLEALKESKRISKLKIFKSDLPPDEDHEPRIEKRGPRRPSRPPAA